MDVRTHMCMGVLRASSEKVHAQKCPESWVRFSPYRLTL